MGTNVIDYDALAKQHGAINIDYDALANQSGAIKKSQPFNLAEMVKNNDPRLKDPKFLQIMQQHFRSQELGKDIEVGQVAQTAREVATIPRVIGSVTGKVPLAGAITGGLGEAAAQAIEVSGGARENINPLAIGAQAGMGAVMTMGAGKLPKLVKGTGIVPRATRAALVPVEGAAMGAGATTVSSLAEGQLPTKEALAEGALLGTALRTAPELIQTGAQATKNVIQPTAKYLTGRVAANLAKPKEIAYNFGKRPDQALAVEGITGKNFEDLTTNVNDRLNLLGERIDQYVNAPEQANKRLNVEAKLDNIINEAKANVTDQELLNKINTQVVRPLKNKMGIDIDPETGIESIIPKEKRDLNNITPGELWDLKKEIGGQTKWENAPFEKPLNQLRVKLYGDMKDAINSEVPMAKELNERYANLLGYYKALEKRFPVQQRGAPLSLSDYATGGLAGAGTVVAHGASPEALALGLGAIAAKKLLGSTAAQSTIASGLGKIAGMRKTVPPPVEITPKARLLLPESTSEYSSEIPSTQVIPGAPSTLEGQSTFIPSGKEYNITGRNIPINPESISQLAKGMQRAKSALSPEMMPQGVKYQGKQLDDVGNVIGDWYNIDRPEFSGSIIVRTGETIISALNRAFAENKGNPVNEKEILSRYNIEQRANGGNIEAGKPYLVGEKGTELIIPSKDGVVIPHSILEHYAKNMMMNKYNKFQKRA